MAKDRDHKERGGGGGNGEKKMFVGVIWNCAPELKLLLAALLILCSVATLLQFLPSRFTISPSDLRLCLSKVSTPITTTTTTITTISYDNNTDPLSLLQAPAPSPPLPSPPPIDQERILNNSILKRAFNGYGAAAYNFITMGAYRGGASTFAVVGCRWSRFMSSANQPTNASGFPRTILKAPRSSKPGGVDFSLFSASSKPKYDYFYCGSSLYEGLSAQRMLEIDGFGARKRRRRRRRRKAGPSEEKKKKKSRTAIEEEEEEKEEEGRRKRCRHMICRHMIWE